MARKLAQVEQRRCVGCGSCVKVCPLGAIAVHRGLYAAVDPARCVGCGRCAATCPAAIITVIPREEPA